MPAAEFRLFLDNAPVERERLERFGEIRVDQAIGMATEAELELAVETDDNGRWSLLEDDWAQPFRRARVEVKVGDGDFVPLIDGPVVSQRFELEAGPGASKMILVAHDDSVLLNREEKVLVYEDMSDSDIASQLISEYGLTPEVDTVPAAGAAMARVVVQRGTNMQLLRELARRHGMFAYVKPGAAPGRSVGVFARPRLAPGSLPEVLLLGPERNVGRFSARFDALRPMQAAAGSVTIADRAVQSAQAQSSGLPALEGDAVHDVVQAPATTLLARTREEPADLDAATQAAADQSSWGYSASAELDAASYPAVVRIYDVLRVAGTGGHLSGDYLVSRVTHTLTASAYRQELGLRRNARSRGPNAGGQLPGGIL